MAKDAQCLHGRNGLTAGLLREANSAHKVVMVGRLYGPVSPAEGHSSEQPPQGGNPMGFYNKDILPRLCDLAPGEPPASARFLIGLVASLLCVTGSERPF